MATLEFVAGTDDAAIWEFEALEHPALPLWIATQGERLAAVSMRTRSILEAHARRCGAQLAEQPRSRPSAAARQLKEYLAHERESFALEILRDPQASGFEHAAWVALAQIPFGETRSYGEQARMLDKPGAARAVGRANSRNPWGVVVPCHRVIGANGALTGFTGGLDNKRWLLAHEGIRVAPEAKEQLGFGF